MRAHRLLTIALFSLASGYAVAKESHRGHSAHVHGKAKLSIAFDQLKGKIEFKSPAQSVLGFEYVAKTEADRKRVSAVKNKFENDISKMISFDSQLKCQITPEKIDQKMDGKHSDFVADYQVVCAQGPQGSVLKIDFSSFPAVKDLEITVLVDNLQKAAEAHGRAVEIELK